MHTYIHAYVHTYVHAYIHSYILYIHTCTHACMHTYIHLSLDRSISIFLFVYIHRQIYTYIHICIYVCLSNLVSDIHIYMYIHIYMLLNSKIFRVTATEAGKDPVERRGERRCRGADPGADRGPGSSPQRPKAVAEKATGIFQALLATIPDNFRKGPQKAGVAKQGCDGYLPGSVHPLRQGKHPQEYQGSCFR